MQTGGEQELGYNRAVPETFTPRHYIGMGFRGLMLLLPPDSLWLWTHPLGSLGAFFPLDKWIPSASFYCWREALPSSRLLSVLATLLAAEEEGCMALPNAGGRQV